MRFAQNIFVRKEHWVIITVQLPYCNSIYSLVSLFVCFFDSFLFFNVEKNCGRSTADVTSRTTIVNNEPTGMREGPKLTWFEWLKEPSLYKVSKNLRFHFTVHQKRYRLYYFPS